MISLSKCPTQSLIKYSNTLGGGISAFYRYNANKTCDSYSSSSRSYSNQVKSSTTNSEYNKLNLPVAVKPSLIDRIKEYSISLGFQGNLKYNQVVLKQKLQLNIKKCLIRQYYILNILNIQYYI